MKSVHQEVISRIGTLKPGSILFPTDFRGIGTDDAIKKALSRLVKDSMLERLALEDDEIEVVDDQVQDFKNVLWYPLLEL